MDKINVVGVPYDKNGSYLRGPALAPKEIRNAFYSASANTYNEEGVDLSDTIHFVEDLLISNFEEDIENGVFQLLDQHPEKLVALGGDHSITFPILKAYKQKYGNISLLHIDAHPDTYEDFEGNYHSHASPFARAHEHQLVENHIQVGIRTATAHQLDQMKKYGIDVVFMRDFDPNQKIKLSGKVYLTLDIDALDPAFAPGISHYEPGGMSTRDLISFLQNQQHLDIIGADIVELNPARDIQQMTAMVSAKLLKEVVTLML